MAAIDDIKNKVDGIESALSNISGSLGGFIGNKGFDDGIKKLESILTNNYKKSTAKNSNLTGSTAGGRSLGNTVGNILGVLETTQKSVNAIGGYAKDTLDAIKRLENHITTNSSPNTSPSKSKTPSNSSTSHINNDIKSTVEDIRNAVIDVRNYLLQQQVTGNTNLNNLINSNIKISEKERNFELRKKALENGKIYDKNGRELKPGSKNWKKEKESLEKEINEREKLVKKRKNRTDFKEGIKGVAKDTAFSIMRGDKQDASKTIDALVSKIPGIWGMFAQGIKALFDLGTVQDRATTNYARVIGGNNQSKVNIGETVRSLNKGWGRDNMYGGYRAEDAYSALTEMAEVRGRTIERQSQQSVKSLIDLKRFGIGSEAINGFDTFGKSVEQTDRYFAKLYNEVSKKGLSFKSVSKAVNDNLKAAQSHTFANGLRGLEQMAEKSTQLKYNMQQVFQFADKVSEIEGAISTAANLSVLGGSFAQYSNPLQMLYEGLNDSEALQDRIQSMFGGKAFYNQKTKQIDMSALDKEFVKQAAKSMGLDPNEMLNISYNSARLQRIEEQIQPGLSKDTAEYIKNIAELDKNGNGVVNIGGEDKLVSDLKEEDRELLKKESKLKDRGDNAKLGDIYMRTSNIAENMDNMLSFLQEKLGRWVFSIFQTIARKENNRQEIVMNGKGDDDLKEMRMRYYNDYSLEKRAWTGERRRWAEKIANGEFDNEIKKMYKTPQSPNGFNPMIPGNSGILKGPSHFNGGIKGIKNGIPWEAEGGEYLINKNSSLKYRGELNKIQNGTFNPYSYGNELIKNDMGRYFNALKVAPVQQNVMAQGNISNSPASVNGRIKIDIPDTITIKVENGSTVGNLDTGAISSMVALQIMKEWQKQQNFSGYDKENFPNKTVIFG